jgi:quinolinate synthase
MGTEERNEILENIARIKREMGRDLLIFAHFYQSDEIVAFADFVGDSLQLAREAAQRDYAPYVIVCAVSFMAEMARILCGPRQEVLHPEPEAKCPLAATADIEAVERAWGELAALKRRIIPVVYVNSTSELKAFCGRHGGTVCTSSNAVKVFQWVLGQDTSVFFFPDENLGRNVSRSLGIEDDRICVVDPNQSGLSRAKSGEKPGIFLWKGHCYVHMEFLPEQITGLRDRYSDIKVASHPECIPELCRLSDVVGATSTIKKMVEESPPGSQWAIATEWNLVNRLAKENPDKLIVPLIESRCSEMASVTPEKLLGVLEGLKRGELPGRVSVPSRVAEDAKLALKRMLEIA